MSHTDHPYDPADPPGGPFGYRDPDILERMYWEDEMSCTDIGEVYGVVHRTVWGWLDRHDIERRPQGVGGGVPSKKGHARPGVWGWNSEGEYVQLKAPDGERVDG